MKYTHPLASPSAWSEAVYFTPFVGDDYERGLIDGTRVLLLGESHYGTFSDKPGSGADCTQDNFGDYTNDSCDFGQSQFFRKLPRIVARNEHVTQMESAAAWRRIAYANFV